MSRTLFPSEEELEYSEATREVSSVLVLIKDDNKSSKKYLSTSREEISYVPTKNIFLWGHKTLLLAGYAKNK